MAPNSPLPAHFSFMSLILSKNALVVGRSNFSTLTAPIIPFLFFPQTAGSLSSLFCPLYVVHGSSDQVVFILPLVSTGFSASNSLTQWSLPDSSPDQTRFNRMRCYNW